MLRTNKNRQNSGIYIIRNIHNNKIYIGSAININKRFASHKSDLNKNSHGNQHLQKSWIKYGSTSFKFEVIEFCDKKDLISREQHYIDLYDSSNHKVGYNICKFANSSFGVKRSDEFKKKMSLIKTLNPTNYWLGKTLSKNHKTKIGLSSIGRNVNKHHGSVEVMKPDGVIIKCTRYRSRIWHNGKRWNLGCFSTKNEASEILCMANKTRQSVGDSEFENRLKMICKNNKNKKTPKPITTFLS